jgi:hypothetical protein
MSTRNKHVTRPISHDDEAAVENAWRMSGNLHVIADRLAFCRLRNEPPPEWLHKALLDLATASTKTPHARLTRPLVRYVAVREAHDREGLTWENAYERAAEVLHGQPAGGSAETMRRDYKVVRNKLRAAGVPDGDPGYRLVDPSDTRAEVTAALLEHLRKL